MQFYLQDKTLTLLTILILYLHLHLHCTTHTYTTSTTYKAYNAIPIFFLQYLLDLQYTNKYGDNKGQRKNRRRMDN